MQVVAARRIPTFSDSIYGRKVGCMSLPSTSSRSLSIPLHLPSCSPVCYIFSISHVAISLLFGQPYGIEPVLPSHRVVSVSACGPLIGTPRHKHTQSYMPPASFCVEGSPDDGAVGSPFEASLLSRSPLLFGTVTIGHDDFRTMVSCQLSRRSTLRSQYGDSRGHLQMVPDSSALWSQTYARGRNPAGPALQAPAGPADSKDHTLGPPDFVLDRLATHECSFPAPASDPAPTSTNDESHMALQWPM
ncbi:hypothetical protein M011DRAFT_248503 [Sporormia fimetaria CBS 119925]|uniref:Uncharacterized protein n=1 Tax=Sporormia fimetaria CBS 119925 TaxID=1340428 RepID=A0A6A6UZ17_9PLEO|nr:hypothetical protein M011DRAFT_248503 [Sporormia fimetaria CBS 119925]